jgi:Ca-activated chloride channel family protein
MRLPGFAIATLFLFSAVEVSWASAQPCPQRPDLRTAVISLWDKQREDFVQDVKQSDLRVVSDGRTLRVECFQRLSGPMRLGIVIDVSASIARDSSAPRALYYSTKALKDFIQNSDPSAEFFIDTFARGVTEVVPLTAERNRLLNGLGDVARTKASGNSAVFDATLTALERFGQQRPDRKGLIIVTDGGDNISATTPEHLRRRFREDQIQVFLISFDPHPNAVTSFMTPERRFAESVREIGGHVFYPSDEPGVDRSFNLLLREINSQFQISFRPGSSVTGWQKLKFQFVPDEKGKRVQFFAPAGFLNS